ncbi:Delta-1-pyrroline-5-carboxylate synthase [Clonorchis sinensis]|uniref:Delta-1-pyrroline-5-carboxylate synthase n=1 Tax=Clonorchis sinensis TaxID=79923 RepID=A0A419PW15_CLOSI|nr:Delta-1-pyrroline-5-carboxylate synthase [Clonorchis sinensis]
MVISPVVMFHMAHSLQRFLHKNPTPQNVLSYVGRLQQLRSCTHSQVRFYILSTRAELKDAKKIVIKLGSAVVTKSDRNSLALGRLSTIVEQISDLCHEGRKCTLVTSGAVAIGGRRLDANSGTSSRSARAAVGMTEMVSVYSQLFEHCGLRTAVMLLTPVDFDDLRRREYWTKALTDLMDQGVVPIINTNDSVAWVEECNRLLPNPLNAPLLRDNDSLAARLACLVASDLLFLVSDVDGVYTAPPDSPDARLLSEYVINRNGDSFDCINGDNVKFGSCSKVGTGGMQSKVASAVWAVRQGTSVVVCPGNRPNCITDVIRGAPVGTFFTLGQSEDASVKTQGVHSNAEQVARDARLASVDLHAAPSELRSKAIDTLSDLIMSNKDEILSENTNDIRAAEEAGIPIALKARLQLSPGKLQTLSTGLRQIATRTRERKGHVGCLLERTRLAENLVLDKVTAPIGVLMVIFESRPDCLPQIAALSIATANGLIAKPGSEALRSVRILHRLIKRALTESGLPATAVGLLEGRQDVQRVLGAGTSEPLVDLIIPRGSSQMIKAVRTAANEAGTGVPVLGHGSGVCHVYVDEYADPEKAIRIVTDSKCNYPAACNSMETLLVHQSHIKSGLLERLSKSLGDNGVECFVGPRLIQLAGDLFPSLKPTDNMSREYGDLRCLIEIVENVQEAVKHIATYGSSHTDAIITEKVTVAEEFLQNTESACVFHNASTRFADGYRFGLGAEVGISTDRIHARGPVGVEGLLTYKWILRGDGQCVSDFDSGDQIFRHEPIQVN